MPNAFSRTPTDVLDRPSLKDIGKATSLATAFAAVSAWRADALAIRSGDRQITYAKLDQQSAAVAQSLIARGVQRGDIVAIYLPRGIEIVAAMLGVIRAGAAYLPLDPTFPTTRVLDTLADAQPALLLTVPPLLSVISTGAKRSGETPVLGTSDDAPRVTTPTLDIAEALASPAAPTEQASEPSDLAYVIYTSGSTGKPKGVMVSHRNVLRLFSQTVSKQDAWFSFNEQDVWTMFHSFAFDFSVWEIWGPLLTGGTLVIVPYDTSRSPEDFFRLLSRERVTVLSQTPTAFGLLSRAVEANPLPLALRTVIFGGEALNLRALAPWVARFGDARPELINMYGITETTVHVTYRRVLAQDVEHETDSLIGQPIPDLQLHLLDEYQQPVAPGQTGEMFIGGDGVALGYLNRPELTAERFLPNPFGPGRLYRSGDLARIRPDGELVYLGRADRQVKINGFRVEPGEIEAALLSFPGIQQACVAPITGTDNTTFLAAYFVANTPIATADLAADLTKNLPAHMRPTFFRQLPALPLTGNGKVDRDALPRPDLFTQTVEQATPLPQQIATLWAAILQLPSVAEADNFFDSGGTSLQLLALRSALQQKLSREIPVLWLFEHTTPSSLADRLTQSEPAKPQASPAQTAAARARQSFARARAFKRPV